MRTNRLTRFLARAGAVTLLSMLTSANGGAQDAKSVAAAEKAVLQLLASRLGERDAGRIVTDSATMFATFAACDSTPRTSCRFTENRPVLMYRVRGLARDTVVVLVREYRNASGSCVAPQNGVTPRIGIIRTDIFELARLDGRWAPTGEARATVC